MHILVTGGAGFIGSHLCRRLLSEGHVVVCVDNLFTGSKDNIAGLEDNKDFTFVEHDIIEPLYLEGDFDRVYNLACPASPVHYQHNPIRTIKANTKGVINMLGFSLKHGARFLQASTSEVYGDPKQHPQTEEYRGNVSTTGPRACYDEGKRVAETLCYDYHRAHDLDVRVMRIFNTYGPNMALDDGRVVSNFIVQALSGDDLTVYGDGSQTRSFCFVSDLVEGMVRLMETEKDPGPTNVGNPDEFTILELAQKVLELTGADSTIVYEDLPVDDPTRRRPDISKAKSVLGWEPTIPLEEGLEKTIPDFKKRV